MKSNERKAPSDERAMEMLQRAAWRIRDPRSGRSLWEAGRVGLARVEEGRFVFRLMVDDGYDDAVRQRLMRSLGQGLEQEGWEGPVDCEVVEVAKEGDPSGGEPAAGADSASSGAGGAGGEQGSGEAPGAQGPGIEQKPIEGVKHVVAVASGKGGVGKSTVAVQLAVRLADQGLKVGLLDADLYGPSLPTLLPTDGKPQATEEEKIIPPEVEGIKCLSIGMLLGKDTPLIWRGPLVSSVVKQFLHDTQWGPLDVLVIDLPPGTGDTQLTMVQSTHLSGAVIVSTPQDLALLDAVRGLEMFRKTDVPILGVVENMAWYALPNGERDYVFGESGARRVAERYGVRLLAEVPLDTRVRKAGDEGRPRDVGDGPAAEAFTAMAREVAGALSQDR